MNYNAMKSTKEVGSIFPGVLSFAVGLLQSVVLGVSAQTIEDIQVTGVSAMSPYEVVGVNNVTNTTNVSTTTASSTSSTPQHHCDDDYGGIIAGAVVAALLVGAVIGAVVMYFVIRTLKTRKLSIPPKDYNDSESSALDINMENGETTCMTDDTVTAPAVKGHRKLERLSKQGQRPVIPPKPVLGNESPSEESLNSKQPLIHIEQKQKDNSNNDDIENSYITAVSLMRSSGIVNNETNGDVEEGEMSYGNTGVSAGLSQPYDSLDVIPEEVEYANTQEYEELGLVEREKQIVTT